VNRTPATPPALPPSIDRRREAFLSRVRVAVGTMRTKAPAPQGEDSLLRLCNASHDVVGVFERSAARGGMRVRRVREADLASVLATMLADVTPRRAAVSISDTGLRAAALAAITRSHLEAIDCTDRPGLDAHFDAGVGITDVTHAIAESGTLVLSSEPHGRGSFVVPAVHVALVRVNVIVPDLLDLWPRGVDAQTLPASLVLVSGPSKTADIEGILITGVHGPREVRVVVIEP